VVAFSLVIGATGVIGIWIDRLLTRAPAGIGGEDAFSAAQNAFHLGDLTGAINHARAHLTSQPDDIHTLYLLARALIYRSYGEYNRADDRPAAVALLRESAARRPRDPDVLAVYALALAFNGEAARAAEIAQRALETPAPSAPIARTALAIAYNSVGSFQRGLAESESAVVSAARGPALVDALRAMAIGLRDTGRYAEAIAAIDRAIALDDRLLALHFERAQFALLLGDSGAATVSYFAVLTRDVGNVKARLRLCELSSIMRERERAIEYCHAVTQYAPAWFEGWYRLGMEYFLQGDFARAQSALHRCTTLQTLQGIRADALRYECWTIQGQAAEIRGDCPSLHAIYNEWRAIAADRDVRQRWTYPPEGPPACPPATG
jgi:tetratricopeptide (TPR) repeat protein